MFNLTIPTKKNIIQKSINMHSMILTAIFLIMMTSAFEIFKAESTQSNDQNANIPSYDPLGIFLFEDIQIQQYECLRKINYLSHVTTGLQFSDERWIIYSNLTNARSLNLTPDINVYSAYIGQIPAEEEASRLIKDIQKYRPYQTLWISVESQYHYAKLTCEYFQKLASEITNLGGKVGIFTDVFKWQSVFGKQAACPSLGKYPLMSTQLYCSFGGWKACNQTWNISPRNFCNASFHQIQYMT